MFRFKFSFPKLRQVSSLRTYLSIGASSLCLAGSYVLANKPIESEIVAQPLRMPAHATPEKKLTKETMLITANYPNHMQLLQVVLLHRHGDRSPLGWVPREYEDKWLCDEPMSHASPVSQSAEPPPQTPVVCYKGQLTPLGKLQMEILGQRVRNTYINMLGFLSKELNLQQVAVRSTPTPRTEQSVQNVLKGMYPKDFHKVGISIRLPEDDSLWMHFQKCPGLKKSFDAFQSQGWYLDLFKEEFAKDSAVKELWSFGNSPSDRGTLWSIRDWSIQLYDLLKCMKSNPNIKLWPRWATPDLMERLERLSSTEYFGVYLSKEVCRLASGRFIEEVVQEFDAGIKRTNPHKILICGAHDTSLVPFLVALDVWDGRWPPIASAIVLELFESKEKPKDHFVRLIYNDQVLRFPNTNSDFISWDKFLQLTKPLQTTFEEYEQSCAQPAPFPPQQKSKIGASLR